MSEDLTYSMLHEMLMKKFNLEANSQINLAFKLSSFEYTVDITDDTENKKNEGTVTRIKTDEKGGFEMLCIAIGASIRMFLNYLRPVLMINAAHLKGLYKGTNLVAVVMDGNNQIVPIAFGICKGETCPCWLWWMSVLKECIGDNPNLLFISDRHAAIALAVENEFPLAFHAPDAYKKLYDARPERWSRANFPLVRYNYMTSNSVESVNIGLKKPKYQGTYSESIHFLGNMQQWEFLQNIHKVIPPRMDNPQPGRPKNTKRIQSQGEEPRVIHCSRCIQAGHRRDQCNKPFVVEPLGNIHTKNDQEIRQNREPSFYDPNQHYDNTFHTFNQYTTQPYDQHFTNTSQAYDGHQTESSQMYEQYNSQQYDVQHLDDLNTNGSNSLVPLADAIQERDRILMYTQHNRLHVYVSRVELSTLVVAEQHKDEKNKTENQEKPSCSKKLFD
ncbi:transposase, MuDR, MULE transposase domain protein [Tanacetum coccineum]